MDDTEIVILNELTQKYLRITYMWNLKRNCTNQLISKQKQIHRFREGTQGYPGKVLMGRIVREFEIDMYKLLCLKWITNKDLLYSTGNSAQYYVTT